MSKEEVAVLMKIIRILHDWSGVTDDTPDDTLILETNAEGISLGDLRDASVGLDRFIKGK